jgi:cytidylate kinase
MTWYATLRPSRAVEEHEERCDSLHYRLFRSFMRGSFEGSLNAPKMKIVDADCISQVAKRVVLHAALEGNGVIVGRGSSFFLHDRADALHVFVHAPFEEKVRRLRARGKSENEAIELAETVDRERAEYIKRCFEVEWPDRNFFHLMMNTVLGDEIVVETILRPVHELDKQPA